MKVKIWKSDAGPSTAVEMDARDVHGAVELHASRIWHPGLGEEMHFLASDEAGVLREIDVYVDFEPSFDIWIKRVDEAPVLPV